MLQFNGRAVLVREGKEHGQEGGEAWKVVGGFCPPKKAHGLSGEARRAAVVSGSSAFHQHQATNQQRCSQKRAQLARLADCTGRTGLSGARRVGCAELR